MKRILIIDDDVLIGDLLMNVLELEGYHVTVTDSGREGILLQKKQAFDLVITDIFMPGTDGLEVITQFRKSYPGLKIIAVSGGGKYNFYDYLEIAENLGAHCVLPKPFRNRDILNVVHNVLAENPVHCMPVFPIQPEIQPDL